MSTNDIIYFLSKKEYATSENTVYLTAADLQTNAGAAINNAITAAAASSPCKNVRLPAGNYNIETTIYLKSNVMLYGAGMHLTTLKIKSGCNIDAIRTATPVNNSGVCDLTIDGNKIDNYSTFHHENEPDYVEHGNAINVWLHHGTIERVRTQYIYKHSLLLNYDTGSGTADGLGFSDEDKDRQGNLNKVLWCDFEDSNLEGVMYGWRTMDSWFCYNNIGSNAANLYLEGGTSRFIGNHFDGDGSNGSGPEYNVYCPNGCNNMLFYENIFENTQKNNIRFSQPGYNADASYNIDFSNNIIRTGSKTSPGEYSAIYFSGYNADNKNHHNAFRNNAFYCAGNTSYKNCIELQFCEKCIINGNIMQNAATGISETSCGTNEKNGNVLP